VAILPIHSALQNPDIVGNFQQGLKFGTAQRLQRKAEDEERQLRNLAPAIQSGDPAAFGQAAAMNPEYAAAQQSVGDGGIRRLKGAISFIEQAQKTGNPRAVEAAYQQVRPYLARFGQEPPATFAEAEPKFMEAKARIAMLDSTPKEVPTGFRQFQMTAEAAGLVPGTPEYQQAAKIALGQEGRASNAGYGFFEFEGADGRKRMGRNNPRTGQRELYDETTGQFVPLGGSAAMGGQAPMGSAAAPLPQGGTEAQLEQDAALANQLIAAGIPEAQVDAFLKSRMNPAQAQASVAPAGLAVGRAPEEQAALTTGAQEATKAPYAIQEAQAKSDIEIREAARKAEQEAAIKRREALADAEQKKAVDATTTLGLLDEAERLIKQSTGSRAGALRDDVAATFGVATEGAQAIAALNPVAARLTLAVPRMEGPQSDADRLLYQKAAGDFANPQVPRETRIAALQQMRRLAEKYKGVRPPAAVQRARNPQTGEVLVLRNGQWVPE
jgi:hypothetical protein